MSNAKQAWIQYEADAWFDRNKDHVLNHDRESDPVISLFREYNIVSGKVLEIGSSAGHRLNSIHGEFNNMEGYGLDPSGKAIEYGREHFGSLHLSIGTADSMPYEDSLFDIVIIGFVLYVIDRELLYKVIAEIDRVLKNGGMLVVIDFFSEAPIKNYYNHISEFETYSFKQNYENLFLSSHLYHLMDKSTRSHLGNRKDVSGDYYDKYCISLLRKDLEKGFKKGN
jgi:ubiquinone/menaquinone biosynthesis C-methylase UbiE